jgi:hypothetical protein
MHPYTPCVERDQPDPPVSSTEHSAADDPQRLAMLDAIKDQIRKGVYRPDVRDLARSLASMMVRDL